MNQQNLGGQVIYTNKENLKLNQSEILIKSSQANNQFPVNQSESLMVPIKNENILERSDLANNTDII